MNDAEDLSDEKEDPHRSAYIPFAAHNIQLVLKDGLKLSKAYTDLLTKVSKVVTIAKRSTIVAEELRELNKRITKMVVTRWNSALFMLRSDKRLSKEEFKQIQSVMPTSKKKQKEAKKAFNISDTERDMINELVTVLELFEFATDEMQSNQVSISRVYPQYLNLLSNLEDVEKSSRYTSDFKLNLIDSLKTRFGDLVEDDVCLVFTFLDPNFNERAFSERPHKLALVK